MNLGRTVFAQLMDQLPSYEFRNGWTTTAAIKNGAAFLAGIFFFTSLSCS